MTVKSRLEVLAGHLLEDGRGCAHADTDADLEVRVAELLPGERAVVEIEHRSPHQKRAWGHIEERVGPLSGERREPACPSYGYCGGCVWQHLDYAAQLREKRGRVVRAFAAHRLEAEIAETVASPKVLGYRNKGAYVVNRGRSHVTLGAYRPGSSEIVTTIGCQIVEPVIDRCARRVRKLLMANELDVRYVLIRAGIDAAAVIGLVVRSGAPGHELTAIAEELVAADDVAGVVSFENDRDDGALLAGAGTVVAGRETVACALAGVRYDVPLTSFWQVNRAQAAVIVTRIAQIISLDVGAEVLDAYAGVGVIGITVARSASGALSITSVERDESAVGVARRAAESAGLDIDIRCSAAAEVLAASRLTPTVIVNPPRKGLAAAGRRALADGACRQLIYLSCGPESLARDLSELVAAGFRIARVEPFDLMPGTGQVETLVQLLR